MSAKAKKQHAAPDRRHPGHAAHPTMCVPCGISATGRPVAHALALPPPWTQYPPPFVVRRAVHVAAGANGSARSSKSARTPTLDSLPVRAVSRAALAQLSGRQAIVIADGAVRAARTAWNDVLALADRHAVIVSLGAFASIAGGSAVVTERVDQEKPVCAMVRESNFITRGFALHDIFVTGWFDADEHRYGMRCLQRTRSLREFCRANDLTTVLTTETDTESGSNHPLGLWRPGRAGWLLVMDVSPPVGRKTAVPASPYLHRFIRQALGQAEPHRGQYVVAPRSFPDCEQTLANLCERFPPLRWHRTVGPDGLPPIGWCELRAPESMVTASGDARVIELRTGHGPSEWDLVFGVLTWLKQLLRPPLRACAEARALLRQWALQWLPTAEPAAVPPTARKREYRYLIDVPPERCAPAPAPARADVCVDIRRGQGKAIVVRPSGALAAAACDALAGVAESVDVPVRVDAPRNGRPAAWTIEFPVEPDPLAFDAITAVNRVVQVVDAVVGAITRRPRA